MARPIKEGFDYFPLDTDFFKNRYVKRLLRKYKSDGIIVLVYLWCECYGDKGYYMNLDETLIEDISDDLLINPERVGEIVEYLFEQKWFHKLVSGDGEDVITSSGVQKRYLSIKSQSRRKATDPDPSIWLINDDGSVSSEEFRKSSEETRRNSVNLRISSDKQKQTKANKTEVNKKKQKETEQKDADADSSDSSDGFNKPFSDSSDSSDRDPFETWRDPLYAASRLKRAGVDVKENTLRKVYGWTKDYDERSIDEALEVAVEKKARNIVGYMDTVLKGWAQGSGNPKWVEREEMALAEQKKEYMRPGALTKELMTTKKLE